MKNKYNLLYFLLSFLFLAYVLLFSACTKNSKMDVLDQKDSTTSLNRKLDIQKLTSVLNIKGTENKGEYKVTVPQNDLDMTVDGFRITPPMGLSSWAGFTPTSDGVMVMGDIIVAENEITPVEKVIFEKGLNVTGLHHHFIRNKPIYFYMHIGGMGSEEKLGAGVTAVFDKLKELRGGDPASPKTAEVKNTLDTASISHILGYSGEMSNGVYKITIGRPDINLKQEGGKVSTFLGFNTWAAWQGEPQNAAVAGDFVMLADEVNDVIKTLLDNGIEVVSLHNHMLNEEPRVFFLHYWGVGSADKLAKGLKAALDKTGKSQSHSER